MADLCGKCGKKVYKTEEMKGANKVWHKACFKCMDTTCNISLTTPTMLAHEGKIYCKKHVPKAKASFVKDSIDTKHATTVPSKATHQSGIQKGDQKVLSNVRAVAPKPTASQTVTPPKEVKAAEPVVEAAPAPVAEAAPAPVEAAPVEAAPAPVVEAAPVEAAPVEAAPVEAAPVEAAPVEAAPVEAAPVEVPVEAAPVEAAPVEAAPVEEVPPQ